MDELFKLVEKLTGGDDEQAEAAAREFTHWGTKGLEALEPLLADPDADRRWWAVRALAEIPDPQAAKLLIQALEDPEPAVRACAARGLQERPDERAIPALAAALADTDALVARLAGNALAAAGGMAVPALLETLQDGPFQSQVEAARALALIGDTSSIPALFEVLDSDSSLVEYWANEGLERMGVGMAFFIP
ncbi:MAG: HEAT repeat domain-containing protein [Anaerolineales bacterium]